MPAGTGALAAEAAFTVPERPAHRPLKLNDGASRASQLQAILAHCQRLMVTEIAAPDTSKCGGQACRPGKKALVGRRPIINF